MKKLSEEAQISPAQALEKEDDTSSESDAKSELSNNYDVDVEADTNKQVELAVSKIIQSEFSGPIPPPNIIKGYEDIVPGAADRIISMAEKQAEHRQAMEHIMVKSESRDSLLGVLFAFFLGILCIVAAIIIVILVPQNAGAISGSIIGVAGIGSIIATFIKSTRTSSRNTHSE